MSIRSVTIVLVLAVSVVAMPGCRLKMFAPLDQVKGSGVIVEETRKIADISAIELHAALQARYEVGQVASLVLNGDDNLLPLITSEVTDGRLVLAVEEGKDIRPSKPIQIVVTAPSVTDFTSQGASQLEATPAPSDEVRLAAHGASHLKVNNLDAKLVSVQVSGASEAITQGSAGALEVEASGASSLKGAKLQSVSAKLEVSGASNVELSVSRAVAGSASGASTIRVIGDPSERKVSTSGASGIRFRAPPSSATNE